MSATDVQPEVALPDDPGLRDSLRQAGMLLLECDLHGRILDEPGPDADWFSDLCCAAPLFHGALRQAASTWNREAAAAPVEPIPGLWLIPLPVQRRRQRLGYAVAVLPTTGLLDAEQLAALCGGAGLDLALVRSLLAGLPPARASEVPRLALLLREIHDQRRRLGKTAAEVESVGQQLAESYEEINLLYTITGNMSAVQQPERFVISACNELSGTLPYRWIAAYFGEGPRTLRQLAGHLHVTGDGHPSPDRILELARRLLHQATPDTPIILGPSTGHPGTNAAEGAVLAHPIGRDAVLGLLIAGDRQGSDPAVTSADMKLLGATATHLAIFQENAALYEDLNSMFLGTLEALTSSIDAKDRYTCGHSQRVAHLTQQLARAAGLDEALVGRMRVAGLVHDVGKIGVPERVLTKPGRLNDEEFAWIRRHPEIGHRILKDIPQLADVLPGVLHHHERWDGRGYPAGLHGAGIPLVARLITLADSFDAMSSTRTYRAAMSRRDALAEIRRAAGSQFDPELAPIFARLDFSEFDRLVCEHRDADTRIAAAQGEAA
jgi:HD-GYP domain-containing protein (c-di-GMP phosphodiesterase class II)